MSLGNQIKTVILLGILTGILLGFGYFVGGQGGLLVALIFSIALNFGMYWFSDRIVLAIYGAKPAEENEYPKLHKIVDEVSRAAKIPKPRVYIIPSQAANAFATGRSPSHAAVACTQGIMGLLSEDELRGVISHEISHVRNRDVLITTIAATIAGVISYLANIVQWTAIFGGRDEDGRGNILGLLILAILTPIIALIIQLAISRSREFLADETGARTIRDSKGLASALQKLEAESQKKPLRMGSEATASLFIVNPFRGGGLLALLSTHPPLQARIKRLHEMKI
ncbi:zinc metalloprotease HtpX [Candidatus Woesearchaeota archaeon]|nr:zinc metalloprotease HtpX [Candidatus Woesearchaeota archaeon]